MAKQKIKKGSVYIKTDKGVYPLSVLQREAIRKDSKQVKSKQKWLAENGLIPPPYSPDTLLLLYESNSIFFRCVNQLAIDTAGLGWTLKLKENQKENKTELVKMTAFLERPNQEEALRTIFRQLLTDWGAVGWFGLEVIKNNMGEVAELYHVPAHTIRVHESKDKYCQIRNNKKVWFKRFGLETDISAKDGEEKKVNAKTKANEMIYYRNIYPKSDYYGVPNAIAAIGDIIGLIGLRDYNLAFFENYGIPSAIIILEGDWDTGSDKKITQFLNKEIKGADNAHKTLVVTQPDSCKFTYKPLGVETKEASFRLYEQTRRDDILIAYSMPPERIGVRVTGSLGGNVAEEATKIYIHGVVEPLQKDLEDIMNNKILQSENYMFKFNDIDTRDVDAYIKRMHDQIEHGIMTPNEVRNELGLSTYPEGDKFFMMSNLIEIGGPDAELGKIEKDLLNSE